VFNREKHAGHAPAPDGQRNVITALFLKNSVMINVNDFLRKLVASARSLLNFVKRALP
jgi:hypothetical protein